MKDKISKIKREFFEDSSENSPKRVILNKFFDEQIRQNKALYLPYGETAGSRDSEYRYFNGCVVMYRNQLYGIYDLNPKLSLQVEVLGTREEECDEVIKSIGSLLVANKINSSD